MKNTTTTMNEMNTMKNTTTTMKEEEKNMKNIMKRCLMLYIT